MNIFAQKVSQAKHFSQKFGHFGHFSKIKMYDFHFLTKNDLRN